MTILPGSLRAGLLPYPAGTDLQVRVKKALKTGFL